MIGQKGIPAHSGGVERSVEELATRLVRMGHEVFVYCRAPYTPRSRRTYRGVHLIHLPSIRTKHLDAITHTFFATIDVLFRDADIVHYHGIGPSLLLWVVRLLKPRTPVIATFQCQDYFHQKWGVVARACLKWGEFIACTIAHRTIVVSQLLEQYVKSVYQRRATYIPNGATVLPRSALSSVRHLGLRSGGYILVVSRLVRHKGIHTLIDAMKTIRTEQKLVIVGTSAFTDTYVRELRRRAAGDPRIVFLGERKGPQLHSLYAHASFVMQPSQAEGMSLVLLEALGHGKVVLASDIPEHREVLRGHGFFFRNRSVADCAAKLKFLFAHPELIPEKRTILRAYARKTYDWDVIVARTLELYRECAPRGVETMEAPSGVRARLQTT